MARADCGYAQAEALKARVSGCRRHVMIIGFVLFAAAVVIAAALIVQNPATVTVHAFNQSWNVDMRWLLVAGLVLTAIGLLGLGVMRLGSASYMRLRGERRALVAENKRLAKRAAARSSDRRGIRDRLVATRYRLVGAGRVGQTGRPRAGSS